MKRLLSKLLPYILSFEILTLSFFTCYISVNAADFMPTDIIAAIEYGIENNDWNPFWRFIYESSDGLMYLVSQMGAVANKEFTTWVDNNKKLESLIESNVVPAKKEDNNIVFTQDFMSQIKQALDDYAAENQPFQIVKTLKASDIPASKFRVKALHDTFMEYVSEHIYTVWYGIGSPWMYLGDVTPIIKEGGGFVENGSTIIIYDGDWNSYDVSCDLYQYDSSTGITVTPNKQSYSSLFTTLPENMLTACIVTSDGGNIRVFNSRSDFINYSAGQRKIYYAKDYYDYTPQELTVSIDDLQKSVDGLSDAVEKLQQQITDGMSESEIENLLQQILDELKNNQGGNTGGDNTGGGSSGTGGGDVTVDIDLSTTNSLLERIHLETRSIFDEIHKQFERLADGFESFFIFEDASGINAKYISSLLERILAKLRAIVPDSAEGGTEGGTEEETSWLEEVLEDIRDTLKSMRRWTIADTVIDGVDMLADVVSLVKDFLTDAGAVVVSAAESLGETAEMMTDKFPFSIPWDMAMLVGILQAEPQAPVFHLPLVIESYGINESIDIDMSQFEVLSVIMRSMLTLLYAYGILNMTTKVLNTGGNKT